MKKVLKIAAALMTAAALFVSCSSEPETKYVERIVEVEVPVSTTTEDAATVLHILQSVDGKSYYIHETEQKSVLKGTALEELKKAYKDFTAIGLVQNGDVVMVLYQRNIPEGFVAVEGMTIASSNDYASFGFVSNYKGVFGQIWVNGTGFTDRTVTLSSYYIGVNEVTKDLYKKVMSSEYNTLSLKADPSSTTLLSGMYVLAADEADYDGERPVESLTWFDAVYFCNVYSQLEGLDCVYSITNPEVTSGRITNATVDIDLTKKGYRLPTEAEWEFAARGGHLTYGTEEFKYDYAGAKSTYVGNGANYPSTSEDTAQFEVAWCDGNAYGSTVRSGQPGYGPHRTGQKKPNALGIFDMSGNVAEWCNDWGYSTLEAGTFTNPCIWNTEATTRIKKGGSFASSPNYLAVGAKNSGNPNSSYGVETGFRLVRTK